MAEHASNGNEKTDDVNTKPTQNADLDRAADSTEPVKPAAKRASLTVENSGSAKKLKKEELPARGEKSEEHIVEGCEAPQSKVPNVRTGSDSEQAPEAKKSKKKELPARAEQSEERVLEACEAPQSKVSNGRTGSDAEQAPEAKKPKKKSEANGEAANSTVDDENPFGSKALKGSKVLKEVYEKFIPAELRKDAWGPIRLSSHDKSKSLVVSDDGLEATGYKGYRSVRSTYCATQGDWYFEIKVLSADKDGGNVRVGWSTRRAELEGPVGCDKHGYSIRDMTGEIFHQAAGRDYGEPFGPGDVVGCRIVIPDIDEDLLEQILRAELAHVEWRLLDLKQGQEPPTVDHAWDDARIEFFKNGEPFGVAQRGLAANRYFPSVSLYKKCTVRVNFGPDLVFPAPDGSRPMSDLERPEPDPEPESDPETHDHDDVEAKKKADTRPADPEAPEAPASKKEAQAARDVEPSEPAGATKPPPPESAAKPSSEGSGPPILASASATNNAHASKAERDATTNGTEETEAADGSKAALDSKSTPGSEPPAGAKTGRDATPTATDNTGSEANGTSKSATGVEKKPERESKQSLGSKTPNKSKPGSGATAKSGGGSKAAPRKNKSAATPHQATESAVDSASDVKKDSHDET